MVGLCTRQDHVCSRVAIPIIIEVGVPLRRIRRVLINLAVAIVVEVIALLVGVGIHRRLGVVAVLTVGDEAVWRDTRVESDERVAIPITVRVLVERRC